MIIGIDIGGTNFRIGALDENNEINSFKKVYVKDSLVSGDVLLDISNIIKENFSNIKIDAISIGIPGTLDKDRQVIISVPNVEGMNNLKAVDYLQTIFNVPVYLEKDVNMLINYDIYKNNIPTKGIITAIYYGTGIGNAIMIDGQLLIGKDGAATEVGHIPVDGCNLKCGCGNVGCIETVAGGKYLAKLNNEIFNDCHISEMFLKHSDDQLIIQFVDRMSMALASELCILNPNKIIIGGGLINMKGFPIDLYMEKLKQHTRRPYKYESSDIIISSDDEKAGVIGACLFAKNKLKNKLI